MKKVLTVLLSLAVMLSCVVFGSCIQAQALEENVTYVPAFSFDFLDEGFQLGGLDDNGLDGESKFVNCQQTVGIYFDTAATSEGAFYGKALKFTSMNGGDGVYVPITMNIKQTKPQRTDFQGATDFVCYIDTRGWGGERGMRPVLTVNGADVTGELTGATNTYYPGDDQPAYIQDASKNWVQIEKVSSGTLMLAENYVGWVRVPLSSFVQTDWDAEDINKKIDLNEVVSIATEVGCYAKNDGNSLIIDEIGFLGNFEDGINQSFLKDGKIADASGATSGAEDASNASGAENNNSSKGGLSTTTWLLIGGGAVVVIAIVVILVVVLGAKKKKTDDGSSSEVADAPAEETTPAAPEDEQKN